MSSYKKLVRDKIPELLDSKGIAYEKYIASPDEYKVELIKKLQEEIVEFAEAGSPEEFADILEVIEALQKLSDYRGVVALQQKKRDERGGFEKRIILKGEKG
ncbi:MAG: nucleoside triphosphate pyrophosphohydrolase [Patescibacteria group bacterium]|nr:nucleoside triphosphate pyrophosphohydrolase [Patescibacteria group bacterium]